MYDNSTLIGGQVSSVRGNLVKVSESNPCPHCGKSEWCYSIGDLSVCNRDQPPATGWEATSKTDKDGHYFYARPQEKKTIRPRQTRYWTYSDRAGNPLVRVVRFDDGEGSKPKWHQESWGKCKASRQIGWVVGVEDITRENIPIYRYADVKKAIANNELIFIVEGESCADILWDLGLAATCNIGGSKKWRSSDTSDLEGAKIVICPDRDEPGIEHANLLHQEFPDALWLYAYPDSPAWNNLPKSQGLDIKDWMDSCKVTRTDILAAVGEKKETQQILKVDRQLKPKALDFSVLSSGIDQLLAKDLRPSELRIKLAELSQEYRLSPQEVLKIYKEKQHEQEQEQEQEDTATEVARLIASKSASLNLSEILPETLAEPIGRLAKMLNLRPECYLLALLTQCGSLLRADTSTMLHQPTNYRIRPNYFGAIVAESSQKKTPILRAIISDPMEKLLDKAKSDYEGAEAVYEIAMNEWKASKGEDKGSAPTPPVRKVYGFTKPTGEGIAAQAGRLPEQGMLYLCDELASLFKSANQYRGGKGSDEEDMLEYWSGGGAIVLRVSGITVDVRNVSLSIFGNIQPKVLAGFVGDGDDNNGKFARFDFVQQPLAATELSRDSSRVDLTPMLTALYERLDTLPLNQFELDDAACDLFISFYNHCDSQRRNHPKQGMRAMLGKAAEKVGKLATIIHCIHAAHRGEKVSKYISVESVRAAIKFAQYTTEQALNINLEVSEPSALAPNLVKIISLAERKGGTVSARDVSLAFDSKHRPKNQQIREWFAELASMKYGEVTSKGQRILFTTATLSTVSTLAQNQDTVKVVGVDNPLSTVSTVSTLLTGLDGKSVDKCGYTVDNPIHTFKPLASKLLEVSVDTVDTKTPPSEILQPLMQSCTTLKATKLDLKIGDAVVVAYSDVSMYRGQKGRIVTVRKSEVIVWFDKLVHGVEKALFPLSDILRI